jgi:pyridoxal phosphate enzyme (YggS family)
MSIRENLQTIQARIRESALKAHRDPAEITMIAVTKYVTVERMNEAIRCGITDIAENKVQDGVSKFPLLERDVTKHLIGTLQTNKVKKALENFDLIHSVDREELVLELAKQAAKLDRQIKFLIQVNVSKEESKHGVFADELFGLLDRINGFPNLLPVGLMTMAPLQAGPEDTRAIFRGLRQLFQEVARRSLVASGTEWRYLSMGMSQDYPQAVEEGANLLRIGTALFNPDTHSIDSRLNGPNKPNIV